MKGLGSWASVPEMEGSPVISEKMARLLRERWKEGLTGGAGLSGGAGERGWALAGRARAGGGASAKPGLGHGEKLGRGLRAGPSGLCGRTGWASVLGPSGRRKGLTEVGLGCWVGLVFLF